MPKATKGGFYAVRVGRQPGVYASWAECESQVKGFNGAKYHKFKTAEEADTYLNGGTTTTSILNQASSSTVTASHDRKPYDKPETTVIINKPDMTSPSQTIIQKQGGDEVGWDVVYCDGACRGNGKNGAVAGVGVWWGNRSPRNISERCPGDQTNNRAELIAITRVLETAPESCRALLIKTDSQYSIKCFHEWLPTWKANNWRTARGDPVKNKALIRYAAALLETRSRHGKVRLKYVPGHSGVEGNEGADRLAVAGATGSEEGERDWDGLRRRLEAKEGKEDLKVPPKPVEFEVMEGDLWPEDELEEIEREMKS